MRASPCTDGQFGVMVGLGYSCKHDTYATTRVAKSPLAKRMRVANGRLRGHVAVRFGCIGKSKLLCSLPFRMRRKRTEWDCNCVL